MSNADLNRSLKTLPEALRALPQVAPEQSAWPQLAAELRRESGIGNREWSGARSVRRRWAIPAALAASVALIAIGLALLRQHGVGETAPVVATSSSPAASISTNAANNANGTSTQTSEVVDEAAQLASLQQRSQALERWLRDTGRAAVPLPGPDLAAAAKLEDMIAVVDGQLGVAAGDIELPLWQRRVALLKDLAALHYANYRLAENGIALR